MKSIYTKLSPVEVEKELVRVARTSSLEHDIKLRMAQLGTDSATVRAQPAQVVGPFLANLAGRIDMLTSEVCKSLNVHMHIKWLVNHSNEHVRGRATSVHTKLRANHMSSSASKRARLE